MKWYNVLFSAIFPNTCISCGEIIKDSDYFCDYCYEMLENSVADKICVKCGLLKKNCDCKRMVYHFNGCVAPFNNEGIAQKAMYEFKFRKKEYIATFFAEQMALFVKQCFPEIEFDVVAFVPMHFLKRISRGYNQSFLLAEKISKILNITLVYNLLGAKFKRKTQHSMSFKDRFKNVKDKYYCKYNIEGKTVLLVDDIKTTGATLDECAKQLMINGANKVYCVTGLMTYKDCS